MKRILLLSTLLLAVGSVMAQNTFKKYDLKSCIAKTQTSMGGGGAVTEGTLYVDDYGAFECDIKKVVIPGLVSYDAGAVTRKDRVWIFSIDEDGKVNAKESPNPTPDLNFLGITDSLKERYEMEDLGEEEYGGRTCHKYSYVILQNRKKVYWTVWAYKGVAMKSVAKQGRKETVVEVVELKENVPIPKEILHLID